MAITRAFISPEELYPERQVTYDAAATLAASLNRAESLHFLAFLNLLLSSATTETELTNRIEPVHEVQTWLFREVVSETLLRDLKAKFRDASLLDRPILHRTQLLFALRLVATHGDAVGGNMLAARRDFDVIGDLLFLINGLFHVDPPASEASKTLWLATQMGPMYETENPPNVELSWPRIQELLLERLPAAAPDPAELERLEQITVFTTGFGIQAWIDLSWMVFSFWAAVTFKDLMQDRGRGYINLDAKHTIISKQILERALNALAVRFDDLPQHLRIDAFSRATLFDLTPFRAKPLWIMPDGRALCVDAALLMERLGPHVFWSVMNALDTPERRNQFSATWGLGFERYCLDGLAKVFGAKKWIFIRNAIDSSTNEELSDAVATRDDVAVLVECKGTFITSAEKYSGVPGRFMRGLTRKFGRGKHGGVHQLVRAISHVWFQRVASESVPRSQRAADVYPILIVQDPIVGCGPVAKVLSDRFQKAIEDLRRNVNHKTPRIWPLLV